LLERLADALGLTLTVSLGAPKRSQVLGMWLGMMQEADYSPWVMSLRAAVLGADEAI